MLNFNQIRVFYHVAKNLSFTMAAKELFITQPAVTAQIKAFEDYSNLKLYKRRGRNIYLTEAGKTLYHYVRRIFEYEIEIENVIADLNELKRGVLRLGAGCPGLHRRGRHAVGTGAAGTPRERRTVDGLSTYVLLAVHGYVAG